jgi:hypothetical protein
MRNTIIKTNKTENFVEDLNEFNQLLHIKYISGAEAWWTYDDNGNCIHYKSQPYNTELWIEYDENGNRTFSKDSTGLHIWYKNGVIDYFEYRNNQE